MRPQALYLSRLGVNEGQSVFPPVLFEGLLLLTLQGLGVVILINAVLKIDREYS